MAPRAKITDHVFYPNKGKCRALCFTCGGVEPDRKRLGDLPTEGKRWALGCRCTPCYQEHLRELKAAREKQKTAQGAGF